MSRTMMRVSDLIKVDGDGQILEGDRIAESLGARNAVILRNHGLLTVGHTIDAAAWWFITMERTCQAQLLAEAAGTPIPIDPDHAKTTRDQVGSAAAGCSASSRSSMSSSKSNPTFSSDGPRRVFLGLGIPAAFTVRRVDSAPQARPAALRNASTSGLR